MGRESGNLNRLRLAVILVPALVTLVATLIFVVEVPQRDDWGTPGGLYLKMLEGNATSRDFFGQHNESRPALPRLLFALLGLTIGWNIKACVLLSWLCCLGTALIVPRLLPRGKDGDSIRHLLVTALISLIIFSPAQSANQLWAIMLVVFLPPLCIVASLWLQATSRQFGVKTLGCAALSFLSTFSLANGMLCWVLAFPVLALSKEPSMTRRKAGGVAAWTIVYVGLALATMYLYFHDYRTPPGRDVSGVAQRSVIFGIEYFVTWIGAPFTFYTKQRYIPAAIVGAGILLALFASLFQVARRSWGGGDRRLLAMSSPFVLLAGYGFASCLATTLGRMRFGLPGAQAPRYATTSAWFTIGLVGILFAIWVDRSTASTGRSRALAAVALCVIALLTVPTWVFGFTAMRAHSLRSRQALLTLRLLDVAPGNPLLDRLHPRPRIVRERAPKFLESGLLHHEPVGAWLTEKLQHPDGVGTGRLKISPVRGETRFRFSGWAVIPGPMRAPDFVILAVLDSTGVLRPLTGFVMGPRADVAERLKSPGLLYCGFSDTFAVGDVEPSRIRVFAVDLAGRQLFRLPDSSPAERGSSPSPGVDLPSG